MTFAGIIAIFMNSVRRGFVHMGCTYEAWRQSDLGRQKLLTNESARKMIFVILVDQSQSLKGARTDLTRSTSEILRAVVFCTVASKTLAILLLDKCLTLS